MEVHPPEHPIHSWRDFFVHIATIVVGLLIAIGLEQTVEYLHRRHQLSETREALRAERELNAQRFGQNTAFLRNNINALRNNLMVLTFLKGHPGTPAEKLPGVLIWPNLYEELSDIAWRTAETTNGTALMPRDEVVEEAQLYEALGLLAKTSEESWAATSKAGSYSLRDPDVTHLSAAELDQEIGLTQDALLAKFRLGVEMANIGLVFKDFRPAPSLEEMNQLSIAPPRTEEQKKALAAARQMTLDRMASTPVPNR